MRLYPYKNEGTIVTNFPGSVQPDLIFAMDLTVTDTAEMTEIGVRSVNNIDLNKSYSRNTSAKQAKMILLSKYCLVACFSFLLMVQSTNLLAAEPVRLGDRMLIFNALSEQGLLNKGRQLAHLVHLCSLVIDNEHYPVIDVVEYVKGAQVPRGVPHIFVLDPSLKLAKKIYYDGFSRPLYCKGNQLFLHGYLAIDNALPEGNVITFSEGGRKTVVSYIEPNDFSAQIPLVSEPVKLDDRALIFNALNEQNLLDKGRQLVHLVHLGNLIIDNEYYPVIAIREHMRGAQVPRRTGLVFVLDSSLKLIKEIPFYPPSNPLYCKNNQLFWYGYVTIDNVLTEGNVITFTEGGKKAVISETVPNNFPAQTPPQ